MVNPRILKHVDENVVYTMNILEPADSLTPSQTALAAERCRTHGEGAEE